MAKIIDPATIYVLGQGYSQKFACTTGASVTRDEVVAAIGIEAADAMVAKHNEALAARDAAPKAARRGSSYGSYGRTGGSQRTARGNWAPSGAEWTWGRK